MRPQVVGVDVWRDSIDGYRRPHWGPCGMRGCVGPSMRVRVRLMEGLEVWTYLCDSHYDEYSSLLESR